MQTGWISFSKSYARVVKMSKESHFYDFLFILIIKESRTPEIAVLTHFLVAALHKKNVVEQHHKFINFQ